MDAERRCRGWFLSNSVKHFYRPREAYLDRGRELGLYAVGFILMPLSGGPGSRLEVLGLT
jgi:hypothetical protein